MTATDVRASTDADATGPAVAAALRTIGANIAEFGDRYPGDTTVDNRYRLRSAAGWPEGANVGWTTGFWPGMLWLAHELSGDQAYLRAGEAHVPSFRERVESRMAEEQRNGG